mmetsp:Transcript_2701/g.7379  ORF Transcript_2701/g.7379 Transcript_2701/m.7379 type:complete len:332 (-) Transcript_2701:46-1041(-)
MTRPPPPATTLDSVDRGIGSAGSFVSGSLVSIFSSSLRGLGAVMHELLDVMGDLFRLPGRVFRRVSGIVRYRMAALFSAPSDTSQLRPNELGSDPDLLLDDRRFELFEKRIRKLVEEEAAQTIARDKSMRSTDVSRRIRSLEAVADRVIDRMAAHTSRPDFALRTAGAYILRSNPSRAEQLVDFAKTRMHSFFAQSGFIVPFPNSADTALDADVNPGNCWAFPGSTGSLTVHLARPAVVDEVVVEHAPFRATFSVASAPQDLRVTLIFMNGTAQPVASIRFEVADGVSHIQRYPIKSADVARALTLDIDSNHGNPDYTCLYRLRVHGTAST